jgi:hypothetical protein
MWWPIRSPLPATRTRIPLSRSKNPSTLDMILTNGRHDVQNICARTALSSDHLPVIFEVVIDVRREIPSHYVFDCKNGNWTHFLQCLDSLLRLDFSLYRIERESDVDSMIQNFTELEARSLSVPLVRPNRHSLTLTPEQVHYLK